DAGLSAVRYPRDDCSPRFAAEECPPFEIGRARLLTSAGADLDAERPDVAVLAFGVPAIDACNAADRLAPDLNIGVWDARFAKPLDRGLIRELLARSIPVVTIEDHSVVGGFGAAVLEAAQEMGLDASGIVRLGLPDSWIYQDSRGSQLAEAGIDLASIEAAIRRAADTDRPPHEAGSPSTRVEGERVAP
ncbi:MAG: transketolase C-terminal domain-containing protein, partial [Planctomycetota bacterium]